MRNVNKLSTRRSAPTWLRRSKQNTTATSKLRGLKTITPRSSIVANDIGSAIYALEDAAQRYDRFANVESADRRSLDALEKTVNEIPQRISDLESGISEAKTPSKPKARAEPKAAPAAEKSLQEKLQAIIDDPTASKRSKQTAFAALDSLTDPDLNETSEERQQNEAYAEKELQSAEKQRRYAAPRGTGQTVTDLEQEIQTLPGKLGDAVRKMRSTGKLKLEEGDGTQGGLYDGKRATLYARGVQKGQSVAMLLHEVGAHMGMQKLLGQKQYDAVIDRVVAMLDAPKGSLERRLAATAYDRIPAEDRARGAEVARDELVAYFVEGVAYAEADGQLPKRGPLRVMWDQIKTSITTNINRVLGTSFGVNDLTPQQIADIATAAIFQESKTGVDETAEVKQQFSVAPSTEALIDSMGPMETQEKPMLRKVIDGFKTQEDPGYAVKFRTQVADSAATIEHRLREQFDGAVKDKLGKFNPMGLYRQAQDYSKMLLEYLQVGGIAKEPATGLWKVKADPKVRPPVEVYALIDKWAAKNGYSRERGTQIASRILEGVRLDAMRTANKNDGAGFLLHLKDNEIDQLVREYKADPDLQAMSKAMDEARLAMVDNMVAVGRLSAEQGQLWKDAAGYVPFDRIEDFATSFSKIKKISNKGLAQVGKLPELVGSINRPVGNVFDNYLNTLGWMVGQTLKTDGTVQTLRSLEDAGHATFLGRSPQGKDNVVGMYVKGEMMYWEVPSKYDVLAFKDLNPPKAKWLQVLGQASNVLRKAVTVLPPFALKQVTDDVQRAIMTSGVKNPGALLRMTLSNFGGLALAELRGIQHPTVKQFGALGLTGEYDFQQGKPATSVLKDLGYKPRGKFETLLHRLDGITRASDLAVRKAIFDQTMKESQGDELLAQTRAREFINFRRRGASDFVGAMVTTIPFFNAYIQGMDVLYRAASGKDSSSSVGRAQARRMFWSRAAIAMTLSSLYALGAGDDEDYQEMDLRTRDGNWILPGGYKIPVPGELGALFKVIPERVVEYMRRQGTPEEQTAWEATRTALTYIMEQYVGRTVPVPQGVKPLLEAWTNYSFFTGRELEGIYQKQQDPSLRRASNTSELAIAISEFSRDVVGVDKISPIMIDNALNGYFGSSAGLLVAVTDSLLNPTRVDRPLHKYALISNYMYDPVGTRRMTEFYEEREKVGRANTTLRELMKTDMDKAASYAESHADELMMESAVNSTLEQLERTRAYRKYLNSPDGAREMSKEEREASLKEIRELEIGLTGWLREAKTAIRQ
jgi:DNA gyrase/topoisomerase IV subunit B